MNIIIFVLLACLYAYKPEICLSTKADCDFPVGNPNNPPCSVCCVEFNDTLKLESCVEGFWDGTHDYSMVHTIYVSGGVVDEITGEPPTWKKVDKLLFKRTGTAQYPIVLVPYPNEDVVMPVAAISSNFVDSHVKYWTVGDISGGSTMSLTVDTFALGNTVADRELGIGFHYVDIVLTTPAALVVGGTPLLDSSLKFDHCSLTDFTGFTVGFAGDSSVSVTNTAFDLTAPGNVVPAIDAATFIFERNLISDNVVTVTFGIGVDISVVTIQNNVLMAADVVFTFGTAATVTLPYININNNYINCSAPTAASLITIENFRVRELVIENNVVVCNKGQYVDWLYTSDTFQGCAERKKCRIQYNYLHNTFGVSNVVVLPLGNSFFGYDLAAQDLTNVYGDGSYGDFGFNGYTLKEVLSVPTADLTGNLDNSRTFDVMGYVRQHTVCPDRVGAATECACNDNQRGPRCEIQINSHEDTWGTVNTIGKLLGEARSQNHLVRRALDDVPLTIRDSCINEYWGIFIDSQYNLWMWGANVFNDYLVGEENGYTMSFVQLDLENEKYPGEWTPSGLDPSETFTTEDYVWRHEYTHNTGELLEGRSIPVKVACTESSVFVLTQNHDLYVLGRNEGYEVDGNARLTSFHKTLANVYDVSASYHTVYVMFMDYHEIPYCVDGRDIVVDGYCDAGRSEILKTPKIKAIGMNHFGCLGAKYREEHSAGQYVDIYYNFTSGFLMNYGDPDWFDVTTMPLANYSDYLEPKPDWFHTTVELANPVGETADIPVYPSLKALEHGFWMTYRLYNDIEKKFKNYHFYAGRDHPGVGVDVDVPTLVNFDSTKFSSLQNDDPIDFVDRIFGDRTDGSGGGCMYLISGQRMYVSGNPQCSASGGITPNQLWAFPQEIQDTNYGEYNHEKIFKFVCGFACYLITREKIFMFGRTDNGIGYDAVCADNNCVHIKVATDIVQDIVPGLGDSVPAVLYNPDLPDNSKTLLEKRENLDWVKGSVFNTFSEHVVYQYPPMLVQPDTGMEDNILTLKIRKPEVFMQSESEIYWAQYNEGEGVWEKRDGADERMTYPYVDSHIQSNWTMWNEDVARRAVGPSDFYYISLPWGEFRKYAAFDYTPAGVAVGEDGEQVHFDLYRNRLVFVEYFYLGIKYGDIHTRREEYVFDIEIRFPKKVLETEIIVQQDEFSEYWDAYIVDKTFDREDRTGIIEFATVVRAPNFFVFPELAEEALPGYEHFPENVVAYTNKKRLATPTPNIPQYFVTESDVYKLEEAGGLSYPTSVPSPETYSCDSKNCYQHWVLYFKIIDDPRVCHIEPTTFPVYWVQFCNPEVMDDDYYLDSGDTVDHPDCVIPSREVNFNIILQIDNLCGGELIETIDATYTMVPYHDWTYSQPIDTVTHIFQVGDWIYFKADVVATEVTITSTDVDTITFVDDSGAYKTLYHPGATGGYEYTLLGDTAQLVIDDLPSATEVGFHFKLHNELLQLQPGEKKTFTVNCYLSVMFEGNTEAVVPETPIYPPRRVNDEATRIGQTFVEKSLDITIENILQNTFSVLPHVTISLSIITLAFVCGICAIVAIGTLVYQIAKRKTRKGDKKEEKEEVEEV